ncbi:S8 family peptidase [Pseudoduganella umbonata]|uniref:Peptidase S8 n=1 Tax=Pseudoduganella umbonata TaxID=864828 RepID=A0A4P8HT42_9BURK|nr:S8 family serine peptidase [Pseudoduganella umbonata]MBB3222967.1 subtilisin family serine protease [Pseudoduganella umbonata]QCP13083.1 peptidase S8 [Pseudoduganella umbonata]
MKNYIVLRSNVRPSLRGGMAGVLRDGATPTVTVERVDERHVAQLREEPEVQIVAPSMPTRLIVPLNAQPAAAGPSWGIAAVGADRSPFTGAGVTVAVLDTGIDAAHPAFGGVQLVQKDFSGDGDGDAFGHGTHCAGTIFGRDVGSDGNATRIGVARGIERALIGKVLGNDGSGSTDMLVNGMTWALQNKAHIISMSLGFDFPGMVTQLVDSGVPVDIATSQALEAYRDNLRIFDAVMAMMDAQGGLDTEPLVVAASGNESRREVDAQFRVAASLPAAADDVLSVAAIGRGGATLTVANFSNTMARISAPGVDITSAFPGGGLQTWSGTSMACPHVAGVAALWWEALRAEGRDPDARLVAARLSASARRNVFAPDVDPADIGDGFLTAPE